MPTAPPAEVSFAAAGRVWLRVAALSFGGPAGQIAVMHRILVEEKRWVSEPRFLHALNYCMLLPGPEAQQLATYLGWLLHGTRGGILAGGLFILPGAVAIMLLSWAYALFGNTGVVAGLFFGLKAAVLAVVLQAVLRLGRRALRGRATQAIAVAAFVAIFFGVPFPLIVAAAGLAGILGARIGFPGLLSEGTQDADEPGASDSVAGEGRLQARPRLAHAVRIAAFCAMLWLAPVGALLAALGPDHVFSQIGVFFSTMAVVTFGGAYAALAYVAQQAVETYGWLSPGEMLDGLGMAETTPGPLIMVLQFVGFMGAYRDPGDLPPLLAGSLGGLLATWVTFLPSFLFIFLGAPFIESLRGNRTLQAGLSAITAAVVGVILNLAIWFALHTLFAEVRRIGSLGIDFDAPVLSSIRLPAVILSAAAILAIFRLNAGIGATLAGCGAAAMLFHLAGWLA